MNDIAIQAENLSKRYQIGTGSQGRFRYKSLREGLTQILQAPFRRRPPHDTSSNGALWALRDVSFNVGAGEVVGVIGRNGAGKSTLLKILSRITEPTDGKVRVRGRIGSLLEVGTGFHPELTGRENIYLNASILGMKRREIQKRFDKIVSFAEMEKFMDTPVKHYSSGMYMRLAFSVAAHLEPDILLVDEVLAVGDAAFQKKCIGKMGDVAKQGRTVLFVSHNMPVVMELCRRTFLMQSGCLIEDGETSGVISKYLSDALVSEQGDFDLSSHPARSTGHASLIKRLSLLSAAGEPTQQFDPDGSLAAELTIETPRPIREPRVALAIHDHFGRRILTVASYFQKQGLPDVTGKCKVRCVIPRLQLGSGRYLVSVSISTKVEGLLDSLDNVAWFEVVWQNNYGNGEPFHPVYGPVLSDSTWETLRKPMEEEPSTSRSDYGRTR